MSLFVTCDKDDAGDSTPATTVTTANAGMQIESDSERLQLFDGFVSGDFVYDTTTIESSDFIISYDLFIMYYEHLMD